MNLERKGKVFLWTGVIMLALAGGVWVANGGIGRIKTALAGEQTGTCGDPGCFSEEWIANELTGDAHGFDRVIGGSVLSTFERTRETSDYDQLEGSRDDSITLESWYLKGAVEELNRWGIAAGAQSRATTTDPDGVRHFYWINGGNGAGHASSDGVTMTVTGWKVNGHVH
jgi:hypothetical protein